MPAGALFCVAVARVRQLREPSQMARIAPRSGRRCCLRRLRNRPRIQASAIYRRYVETRKANVPSVRRQAETWPSAGPWNLWQRGLRRRLRAGRNNDERRTSEERPSGLPKVRKVRAFISSAERLALALPPLTTKDHEKETNTNETKTHRQEKRWWQLSSSVLFADSRAEDLAG